MVQKYKCIKNESQILKIYPEYRFPVFNIYNHQNCYILNISRSHYNIEVILDSERRDECIDFTKMCIIFVHHKPLEH